MKILYVTAFFWPHLGGIETLSLKFLPDMQARGHEFLIITSLAGRELPVRDQYEGSSIIRFPFLKAISERNLLLMKKGIQEMAAAKRDFQPDLVHLQMSAPISFYHLKTLSVQSAPTLLTLHTCFGDFNAGSDTVLGQTLESATWTTAVSESVMSDARKIFPRISRSSSVVYNGMIEPAVSPSPLALSPPRILGFGRLVKMKGFDILVDAYARLRRRIPGARLTLVGDGTERTSLEKQVRDLGLQDCVTFTGQLGPDQVYEQINQSGLVVIPSRTPDPFPTVGLEAGILGRPVVAAANGGLPEMILDGKTGLLVEPENPEKFYEAMFSLIDEPQKAQRLGDEARSRIKNVFGWDRYIDSYDSLYHSLVNKLQVPHPEG
jgi:glycosyltransferase involved in cell wall biosynthesis